MRKTHTEAQARYDKVNRRVYGFRLHNVIDADIIARLAEVDSMQGYIKQLIRDDISRTRTCSVPVPDPVPDSIPVPKKKMSIDAIYKFLQKQAEINGVDLYDIINALASKLMGYEIED